MTDTDMNLDMAPAWRPVVGEVLVGKVLDISRGWSDQAEKYYPIITVKPESPVTRLKDGVTDNASTDAKDYEASADPVAVHAFHTVLYMRLTELRPTVGERVGIKYVKPTEKAPKNSGRKGNLPAIYNVKIDGRTADIWDAMEVDPRLATARARNEKVPDSAVEPDDYTPNRELGHDTTDDDDIPF